MKKFVVVMVALSGLFAMTTQADVNIAWAHPNGYYDNMDVGESVAAAGGDLYAILIWTPDGNVGMPEVGNLAGGGNMVSSGLLVSDFGGAADYGWGASVNIAAPNFDPLGFVVSRVFQANSAAAADMVDVWYYDSAAIALLDKGPADGPQIVDANRNSSANGVGDAISTGQVVPEPSTLALLALGLGTVLFRRRR